MELTFFLDNFHIRGECMNEDSEDHDGLMPAKSGTSPILKY